MDTPIPVEPLTTAGFAPFGEVIELREPGTADLRTETGTLQWKIDFQGGKPFLAVLSTPHQGLVFTKLESHAHVTQSFLPLGGAPAVVAVGLSPAGSDDPPPPDRVRAFLLDGTKGYKLGFGVWHSLDRMPVEERDTAWVIVSDHETQEDFFGADAYDRKDGADITQLQKSSQLTRVVNYAEHFGTTLSCAVG